MAQFPLIDQASLAMIPGAYKESKVYSQLPTDGSGDFTFSRGTDNATIVNEEGLIEKSYGNLLLQSNSFDTSPWISTNFILTSGQAGYDGTNNAWLIDKLTTANDYVKQSNISSSNVVTASVYAKAGTADDMMIYTNAVAYSIFNLSTGSVTFSLGTGLIDSNIENIGNGWYRCSITVTNTTAVYVKPTDGSNNTTGTIYIQDVMLNPGLVAYPYLETTTAPAYGGITANQPRLNYTGDCPSLLVEEGRTNLVQRSEYFSGHPWTTASGVILTSNYSTSPEGVKNSTRIQYPSGNKYQVYPFNGPATGSIYVKGVNGETINFGVGNVASGNLYTLNGDWQRISFYSENSGYYTINTYNGATARDFEIYGAQIEEGPSPSSYIPTYGSTQTRAAETLTATKTLPSEGTLYINVGGTTQPKLSVLGEFFDASTTENKVAIAYSATALKISHNGSIVVDKTGTYDVSSLTEIDLGHDGGTDQADTSIGEFITFGSFLTTTELNALTQ